MEIYELPITSEESRNYHKFLYQLKALNVTDWVKAYITAIVYTLILVAVIMIISDKAVLFFWYHTDIISKVLVFLAIFVSAALQRSKTVQLRAMLQKYMGNSLPEDFLNGRVKLKKIKVQGDRLLVYYRKINY
jgi:hypothetical protein